MLNPRSSRLFFSPARMRESTTVALLYEVFYVVQEVVAMSQILLSPAHLLVESSLELEATLEVLVGLPVQLVLGQALEQERSAVWPQLGVVLLAPDNAWLVALRTAWGTVV